MKKIAAVIMAVMMIAACGCTAAFAAGNTLTREEAMQSALDRVGLKAEQVTVVKARQDWDDGRQIWEIEFVCNGVEYEFEIDALSGRATEVDTDNDRGGWGRGRDDRDDWDDDWDDWFDFD